MMLHNNNKFHIIALALVLALAAFIRFWAAPISASPDVAQFWAFAKVFQVHGLDFYRYADATGDIFPFYGWSFVYPPIWPLILKGALAASSMSTATASMIDVSWRIAEKTPIIMADLAIGCLLYGAVPGSKLRKLLFAGLWLFNPTVWYQSAVFGQFDAIAAAFMLLSLISLERGWYKLAFFIAALAVMTKQHTLIPIAFMLVLNIRGMGQRRFLTGCYIFTGVVIVLSIPFLLTGNISSYAYSLIFPGHEPGYQYPLMYAFGGSGALLTYLHNVFGWETSQLLYLNIPVLAGALLAALILGYRKSVTPTQGALIGILLFIGIFYRINYQYLVIYIPIALLIASRTKYRSERALTILLAVLPALWLWLFDLTLWFNYASPKSPWVKSILDSIGLAHKGTPDYAFVLLALVIMILSLTYVVCAFLRWCHPASGRMLN
ncbi:hypothetical protein ACFLX5_04495 [Chloroflexota bacterium]